MNWPNGLTFTRPDLLALMDQTIARSAATRRDGPWTRSSFIAHGVRARPNRPSPRCFNLLTGPLPGRRRQRTGWNPALVVYGRPFS
jgi:hypothetical protein